LAPDSFWPSSSPSAVIKGIKTNELKRAKKKSMETNTTNKKKKKKLSELTGKGKKK
jgi:hypothetical protein